MRPLHVGFAASLVLALQACGDSGSQDAQAGGGTGSNGGNSGAGAPSGGASVTGGGTATPTAGADTAGSSGSIPGTGGAAGSDGTGGDASPGSAGGGSAGNGGSGAGGAAQCMPSGSTTATDLAFPGAEGFGRKATGGRGGSVYHVTNLNDSGAGSFRDAVSQSNRVVVFDVGGYVTLKTAVSAKSNLTIAGQTAPGGGIGFKSGEISFANSSNIIMRHVRIRPGSETASDTDDALSLFRARNVILDHCSFEFAPWNNIDGVSDDWQTKPVTDITFQECLIADPTGQQFGAHTESVASQWSWYRNIFASSHNRNPLAKADTVFVNNVLYNYSAGYTTHTSTTFRHDIVNNYFVFGPASTGTDNTWFQVDKNQSIYSAGNIKDKNANGTLDGEATTPYWYQGEGKVLNAAWSDVAATALDAKSGYRVSVSQAGTLPRDPLDALIISQVRTLGKGTTGTGVGTAGPAGTLYTSQAQTGLPNSGYGEITGGTKPTDADNDGMPDFWEKLSGTDPAEDDAMKKAADGYAQIEHYLNWLAERHALTSKGKSVDVDLAGIAVGFSDVAPKFLVKATGCGNAELQADGHTARFTPTAAFTGIASFELTVTGSDGSKWTEQVAVAVEP